MKLSQKDKGRPEITDEKWHVEGMKNEQIIACVLYFPTVVRGLLCRYWMDFDHPSNRHVGGNRKLTQTDVT